MSTQDGPRRVNVSDRTQDPTESERGTQALSRLHRAIAAHPDPRPLIVSFNRETYARFERLPNAARSYAAGHGLVPGPGRGATGGIAHPDVLDRVHESLLTKSDATHWADLAAGFAWVARHMVAIARAHVGWPDDVSDSDWRAECRRVRIQSMNELSELLESHL